jgi:hypothetical protein
MLLLCSTLCRFVVPEYLLTLFECWKLSNEISVDLCESRPLRIMTDTSSAHRLLLLNVTKLMQGFNVAMLNLEFNTKINSKKQLNSR